MAQGKAQGKTRKGLPDPNAFVEVAYASLTGLATLGVLQIALLEEPSGQLRFAMGCFAVSIPWTVLAVLISRTRGPLFRIEPKRGDVRGWMTQMLHTIPMLAAYPAIFGFGAVFYHVGRPYGSAFVIAVASAFVFLFFRDWFVEREDKRKKRGRAKSAKA